MKKLFVGSIAALAVMCCLVGCGEKKVNLNDYVTITSDGYDTVGKAGYKINLEKMLSENTRAFDLKDGYTDADYKKTLSALREIGGTIDKSENLSNGDKITFSWDAKELERLQETYPVKLVYSDISTDVSGLAEAETFDPFDYVSVSFTGIAPNGELSINKESDSKINGLRFRPEKSSGLSNGDAVKIVVESEYGEDISRYCIKNGTIPTSTEKEYVVNGLASYVSELSEIPADMITKMNEQAQDALKAHVAEKWVDAETLKKMELLGNYFVTPKENGANVNVQNYVYFIYRIDVENKDEGAFSFYYYTYFTNIMMLEDGTCTVDLSSYTKPEGSMIFGTVSGEAFKKGKYYYLGYEKLDTLFNKQITTKIDRYKYESTVKE